MGHHHGAGHDHAHAQAPADFGLAFGIAIALNLAFVAIEAGYGFAANSMALLADAGHNLSDVLALIIAWVAYRLGKRSEEHTSELQSLMRNSYAVFCLKKKKNEQITSLHNTH